MTDSTHASTPEPDPGQELARAWRERAKRQRDALATTGDGDPNAIAVVGMACRFPGADDVDAYWRNLIGGVESVTRFSREEALAAGADPAQVDDPDYVLAGGTLDEVELFDARFFGINPKEALAMDPQHRLFLECAWNALEDAGYAPETCPRSTAVFGGCGLATSHIDNLSRSADLNESLAIAQLGVGSYADFLCTRVSFKLGLQGPSLDVQTACSTSLVATALAWQALRTQQCDMALAGGVSVRYPRRTGYLYTPGEILSSDGHCRPFDAMAEGTVVGEGVGIVVLKRLARALRDGDRVHAVVRGAALNNDGADKVSFYATSIAAQSEVVVEGLAHAGADPDSISYVECHGTATPLGDPIEIASLTRAFRAAGTDRTGSCAIGSVKSNFGHADAAAGVAGVIKTALALEHAQIPPSLHYESPNPEIDFAATPFVVNAAARAWDTDQQPRRAGINSFGIGGTNAHVVMEQAPALPPTNPARGAELLLLSAKTPDALAQASTDLATHLRAHPEQNLGDVAFTTQLGRQAHPHRRCVVARDHDGAAAALETADARSAPTREVTSAPPPVVFAFPGQGAQHVDMGRVLYHEEPVFRAAFDACAAHLKPHLGVGLADVVYPEHATDEHTAQLAQTRLTQPALFAVEYALAQLWMSWGVRPGALVGHSVGELVAATLAQVFALEDACRIVAARGGMMQELPPGDMLSVPLEEQDVLPLLGEELSLAAVNGPTSCVVAGPAEAVARLQRELDAKSLPCRALRTSHAFHSSMMEPIVAPFTKLVAGIEARPAQLPCLSTVTGDWVDQDAWRSPDYWARNLRQPVRFFDAARAALAEPCILLEVGPGRTLSALVKQHAARAGKRTVLTSLRHPQDPPEEDLPTLQASVGRLWLDGVALDWHAYRGARARRRMRLPTYPFERTRFHLELAPFRGAGAGAPAPQTAARPTGRLPIDQWFYAPAWVRAAQPDPAPSQSARWLLLDDAGGAVAGALAARLEGATVQRIAADALEGTDWDALLAGSGAGPLVVVHLGLLVPRDSRPDADGAQQRGFHAVTALARAAAHSPATQTQILVVTNGLVDAAGTTPHHSERGTVLGLAAVVGQELPGVACRVLDVDVDEPAALADAVHTEAGFAGDAMVALRGGQRWAQALAPVQLTTPAARRWQRDRAVVLITGGLGGIGFAFARFLARQGAPRLVLTGRSAMTPAKTEAVRELEQLGAEVLVAQADVARRTDMWGVLEQARERFGEVHGVFHAAGISDAAELDALTPEAADRVLAAKVKGTLGLAQLLQPEKLDFFVLCSSLSSLLGGLGAAAYAGANAFLDAFARSRGTTPAGRAAVTAVNWDTWRDVGFATQVTDPDERAAVDAATVDAIRADESDALFAAMLHCGMPQVAVSTTDLAARWRRSLGRPGSDAGQVAAAATSPATSPPPGAWSEAAAPTSRATEAAILECVQQLMGLDQVDPDESFFELGVDSLIAHRMAVRLRKTLGVTVPLRAVLEAGTPRKLAEQLDA